MKRKANEVMSDQMGLLEETEASAEISDEISAETVIPEEPKEEIKPAKKRAKKKPEEAATKKKITKEERYEAMSVYEKEAMAHGFAYIAGMDEAGRGPLAGPVVAACVILDPEKPVLGVNDSKKLSSKRRQELKLEIEEKAIAVGVGIIDEKRIDEINILNATKEAMRMAVSQLKVEPDLVLIDAVHLDGIAMEQRSIIKGDALSVSIAAASIIAKETRDAIMVEMDEQYPGYGFAGHKGYGTAQHIQAIKELGPCPIHRRSFITHFV